MAHDLVIRGGVIVDGTGAPRYVSRSSGLRWSFVNGQPIIRDGRLPEPQAVSGAGRVIRAA